MFFKKSRNFSDGITFIELKNDLDLYEGDHTPKLSLSFVILNHTILDFTAYNQYHADNPNYNS